MTQIPLQNMCPRELSVGLEGTPPHGDSSHPANRWEQPVPTGDGGWTNVHPDKGTLLSLKGKEALTPAATGMAPEDTVLSEICQTQKDKHCATPLTAGPETESRSVGAGGGSECFMGAESQCGSMESPGDGGGHTTVGTCPIPLDWLRASGLHARAVASHSGQSQWSLTPR